MVHLMVSAGPPPLVMLGAEKVLKRRAVKSKCLVAFDASRQSALYIPVAEPTGAAGL